jgi:hypothetical protein
MIKTILEIINKVISFFFGKNELALKKLELENTEKMRVVEVARQENEIKDTAEALVKEAASPQTDNKDEALEKLRRLISR